MRQKLLMSGQKLSKRGQTCRQTVVIFPTVLKRLSKKRFACLVQCQKRIQPEKCRRGSRKKPSFEPRRPARPPPGRRQGHSPRFSSSPLPAGAAPAGAGRREGPTPPSPLLPRGPRPRPSAAVSEPVQNAFKNTKNSFQQSLTQ